MADVNNINLNDYEVTLEDNECMCWYALYPYVCRLMQYTGLKDVNGIEVYEGYIVQCEFDEESYFCGEVVFKKYCFCITDGSHLLPLHTIDNIEVIGNIFEDLDLL